MTNTVPPIEPTPLQREQHADSLIDAQSAEGLVQSFRTSQAHGYNPIHTGIDRQGYIAEAQRQVFSCMRRADKATAVESRAWRKLQNELEVEGHARRDVAHYILSGLVHSEALATRAADLATAIRTVDDLVSLLDEV